MAGPMPPRTIVPLGWFSIWTTTWTPNKSVYGRLGMGEVKVVDGYGGWGIVARPRKQGLAEWQGRNPVLVELPFMLDAWEDVGDGIGGEGVKIEDDIRILEKMAGLDVGDPEPPIVHWSANAAHDHNQKEQNWIVEGLEWGSSLRNHQGRRVRQSGTLMLREFNPDEFLTTASLKPENSKPRTTRRYRVKRGDTLKKIAKSELGKASRWREIIKIEANRKRGLRDPDDLTKFYNKTIQVPKR